MGLAPRHCLGLLGPGKIATAIVVPPATIASPSLALGQACHSSSLALMSIRYKFHFLQAYAVGLRWSRRKPGATMISP